MSRPVDHRQGIAVSECSGGPFFGCHFQPCPRRSTCFLGPRPSSLEPIALPHPNSQTTKTCRGTGSGLCPGAVLEPAAVPQPRFRGPRIHPRAPADHPALNHPIPDKRAGFWPVSGWPVTSSTARGGSCAPPPRDTKRTLSNFVARVIVWADFLRWILGSVAQPVVDLDREESPGRVRSPAIDAQASLDPGQPSTATGCPHWVRPPRASGRGAGGGVVLEPTPEPQPISLPSTTTWPISFASTARNPGRRRDPRILRRPLRWWRSRTCRCWRR